MPTRERNPRRTLLLRLRPSRRKAREAAVAEVLAVLRGLDARAAAGGPLAEISGVAWVTVAESDLDRALNRLCGLGYTEAIDLASAPRAAGARGKHRRMKSNGPKTALLRVWADDAESLRAAAPDRRTFLLECADGVMRRVAGYRGGRGALEHRALAVEDARLLVNLVSAQPGCRLLDPFAGAGGVIIEAAARGFITVSVDSDPALRFGIAELADCHIVGDASMLPLATASIDAIAGEPPYHPSALDAIIASIPELARVLRSGGRVALLLAASQAGAVREAAAHACLKSELDTAINRKGTGVSCLCWMR
jgi:SAM-dependent methyltransferase